MIVAPPHYVGLRPFTLLACRIRDFIACSIFRSSDDFAVLLEFAILLEFAVLLKLAGGKTNRNSARNPQSPCHHCVGAGKLLAIASANPQKIFYPLNRVPLCHIQIVSKLAAEPILQDKSFIKGRFGAFGYRFGQRQNRRRGILGQLQKSAQNIG